MAQKDTIVMKYIRKARIDNADFEGVVLNEDVIDLIRASNIDSLKELIGDDPKGALRRLAKDYWESK